MDGPGMVQSGGRYVFTMSSLFFSPQRGTHGAGSTLLAEEIWSLDCLTRCPMGQVGTNPGRPRAWGHGTKQKFAMSEGRMSG
jgi:hypothetical protein